MRISIYAKEVVYINVVLVISSQLLHPLRRSQMVLINGYYFHP